MWICFLSPLIFITKSDVPLLLKTIVIARVLYRTVQTGTSSHILPFVPAPWPASPEIPIKDLSHTDSRSGTRPKTSEIFLLRMSFLVKMLHFTLTVFKACSMKMFSLMSLLDVLKNNWGDFVVSPIMLRYTEIQKGAVNGEKILLYG